MFKKILMVAGELSGDTLGAGLIRQLRQLDPNIIFYGIGGSKMIAEGLQSWHPMDILSVMGITAVLPRLPQLFKLRKDLCQQAQENRIDLFIGLDSPDFNLGLAKRLKAVDITTVQYVSPSIWAWRAGRMKTIQQSIDLMLTLFPFEQQLYQQAKVRSVCVGHPLADQIPLEIEVNQARHGLGITHDESVLALLPGSRHSEIRYNLPFQLSVLKNLLLENSYLKCFLPVADKVASSIDEVLASFDPAVVSRIKLVDAAQAGQVLMAANVALMTSGTVALEALLYKCPMVVTYRWSGLSHWLIAPFVKSPFIALPNILAGKKIVPEFLQGACEVNVVASAVSNLFHANRRALLQEIFQSIHQSLRKEADVTAAKAVVGLCS